MKVCVSKSESVNESKKKVRSVANAAAGLVLTNAEKEPPFSGGTGRSLNRRSAHQDHFWLDSDNIYKSVIIIQNLTNLTQCYN